MSVFIKNYYSSVQQYEQLQLQFFDEGPIVYKKPIVINSSSIDTREIDQFRHGVEITQQKHTIGTFKVSAGTPGHIVRPQAYGIAKLEIGSPNYYTEIDNFNPVNYIGSQPFDSNSNASFTYPVVITSDNNQLENIIFNGIIEPLSIRKVISFFSIEYPYESRAFRGSLMAGNSEQFKMSTDQVVTVDYVQKKLEPGYFYNGYRKAFANNKFYLDAFKIVSSGSITGIDRHNGDYLNDAQNYIEPFVDKEEYDYLEDMGITKETHGIDMYNVFTVMTGSTDNYVPPGKKSATAGFVYDNIGYAGTDSIAFGGLTY